MHVAAIVLAAGGSSRLGEPKQLLQDSSGETLVHKVAREAVAAGMAPVCVVTGAAAVRVREAVADLELLMVDNAGWADGLSTSIRCGVQAVLRNIANDTPLGLLLLTCDMPSVGVTHLDALLQAFASNNTRVASGYAETRGIPAIFPESEFALLTQLSGDKGAKQLLMREDTVVVLLTNGTLDLDTPADVEVWRNAGSP